MASHVLQYQDLITTPLRAVIRDETFHPPDISSVESLATTHIAQFQINPQVRFKAGATSSKESHEPNLASLEQAFQEYCPLPPEARSGYVAIDPSGQ